MRPSLEKRSKIGCCSARYDEGWSGSIKGGTERLKGELKRGSDGPKDRACKVSVGEKDGVYDRYKEGMVEGIVK